MINYVDPVLFFIIFWVLRPSYLSRPWAAACFKGRRSFIVIIMCPVCPGNIRKREDTRERESERERIRERERERERIRERELT